MPLASGILKELSRMCPPLRGSIVSLVVTIVAAAVGPQNVRAEAVSSKQVLDASSGLPAKSDSLSTVVVGSPFTVNGTVWRSLDDIPRFENTISIAVDPPRSVALSSGMDFGAERLETVSNGAFLWHVAAIFGLMVASAYTLAIHLIWISH
jgi:hypothetical protein